MLAACLEDEAHVGETYAIGGPEPVTLAETVRLVCGVSRVVTIPDPIAAAGFTAAGYVPGIPFDRDQYRAFALDNTVADNDVAAFGVDPEAMRTLRDYVS